MKHIGNGILAGGLLTALIFWRSWHQLGNWTPNAREGVAIIVGVALIAACSLVSYIATRLRAAYRPARNQRSRNRGSRQRPRQYQDV